jgi:hypothetical protein
MYTCVFSKDNLILMLWKSIVLCFCLRLSFLCFLTPTFPSHHASRRAENSWKAFIANPEGETEGRTPRNGRASPQEDQTIDTVCTQHTILTCSTGSWEVQTSATSRLEFGYNTVQHMVIILLRYSLIFKIL